MWLRRKPKNRRLGREHVLDVKLRSSKLRVARTRMAAVGLGSFFLIVFASYLLWCAGEWALNDFVYENKSFAVETIDIQTDGTIPTDQLRQWAGLKTGDNLFALDIAAIRQRLEMIPLIQSAAIERIPLHTISIRVMEREAVALLNLLQPRKEGGVALESFQIDADGWVMQPLSTHLGPIANNQAPEQLPVIAGVNPTEVQPGRRIQNPQVQAALALLEAFDNSPMAGLVDLKRIDVSSPDVLLVSTGQGSEITFGLSNPAQQLRRWRDIHDAGQRIGRSLASLDLAISNNIPARWLEASNVPQAAPKTIKLHSRKKHV